MPCRGDYNEPNRKEIELSNLLYVRDELNGIPIDPSKWNQGFHPKAYNLGVPQNTIDRVTSEVCLKLRDYDTSKLSLEAQIWWRDHQKADKDRLERELAAEKEDAERQAAIAKLTPYERKLLNL